MTIPLTDTFSPELHRWLSRDPLEENGGVNLYVFVQNDAISVFDPLGLDPTTKPSTYKGDTSCCTSEKIAEGEGTLKQRYANGVAAAAKAGVKRVSPPANGGTCKNSSSDILEWLRPTPNCWHCYLDERNKYSPEREKKAGRTLTDHQVIICVAYGKAGSPGKEIMFDWWGKAEPGSSPDAFRKKYPYPGGVYEGQSSYVSCDGKTMGYYRKPALNFNLSLSR